MIERAAQAGANGAPNWRLTALGDVPWLSALVTVLDPVRAVATLGNSMPPLHAPEALEGSSLRCLHSGR